MSVRTASSTSKAIERWMKRVDLRGLRLRKVDADGQVIGRLASRLSLVLQGKDKPTYAPHLDNGDVVVVVNASNLDFTGNKWQDKLYRSHSGYPGGLKEVPAERMKARRGAGELLRRAVRGMLPKNKLRPVRMRKLLIYNGPESDFSDAYLWDVDLGSRKTRNLGHSWELPEGFQPMNPAAYWRHFRTSDPEWKKKMQEAFEKLGLDPDGDASKKAAPSKADLIGERLQ